MFNCYINQSNEINSYNTMINEFESQTAAKKSPARSIEEQLALDLAKYLDRFPNKSFAEWTHV